MGLVWDATLILNFCLLTQAINQFGTDFEMIARLFPGRTRKMIKNKWNREEVINDARVTNALMTKVPVGQSPIPSSPSSRFSSLQS